MAAQMRAGRWLIGIVAIGVLAAAVVQGVHYYRSRQAPPPPPPEKQAVPPDSLTLSGKVRARHVVPVAAMLDGTLEDLQVIDGQEVAEGQLLARIRNTGLELEEEEKKQEVERLQERINSLESQLIAGRLEASRAEADSTRAQAQFSLVEKNYQRQKMLLAEGAVARLAFEKTEKEYQTLKTELDAVTEIFRQAQAKVEIGTKNLEEVRKQLAARTEELEDAKAQMLAAEIHAPVDGVLIGHRAEPGGRVTHDMKNLFEIAVSLSALEFVADRLPEHSGLLKPGQTAAIVIPEAGGDALPGVIRNIDERQIILDFDSPNPAVKPGLTAQARVQLETSTSPR